MKTIKVQQFHYNQGKIRNVYLSDGYEVTINETLEKVYHYGQNHIQPVENSPSVSVGDVIFLEDIKYVVAGYGFKELSDDIYKMMLESIEEETNGNQTPEYTYSNNLYKKMGDVSFEYC